MNKRAVAEGDEQFAMIDVCRFQRRLVWLSNSYGFGETPAP
ncbi:MAG: hypothetical protein ACR2MD_06150 [Aridibacter sp.]